MNNKNLIKILKISITAFSILTIINCIGIMNSSNALFEKSVDSTNNIKMKALDYWAEKGAATTSVTNLAKKDKTNLDYDETVDNNLRYIGKDPNNYVLFNNELWRIIGVMNNIDDGTGNKAPRIKLIKAEPAYTGVAFDTNNVNDYSTSSLKTKLNVEYYNRMSENTKNMIDSIVWNLGGICPTWNSSSGSNASNYYSAERSSNVYSGHAVIWIGKVGLMYPSDFLYATAGTSSISRETCLSESNNTDKQSTSNWYSTDNGGPCAKNDYLLDTEHWQWLITPNSSSQNWTSATHNYGIVYTSISSFESGSKMMVRPALYLKSSVKITGGYGTKDRPYRISL